MKKRRSWMFSRGGSALFFLLLLAPIVVGLVRRWPGGHAPQWWAFPLLLLLLLIFTVLAWFLGLRPLIRQDLWKVPRTWYEACFAVGILQTFYALDVFATGYTPAKYGSHPVPRSSGLIYLYWAVLPLVVGTASYVYDKYNKPERRRRRKSA